MVGKGADDGLSTMRYNISIVWDGLIASLDELTVDEGNIRYVIFFSSSSSWQLLRSH